MDYIYSAIFGVVQGATEFLPISSSGHLLILHKLIKLDIANELAFDVALHLSTLLAVVIYFRKDILGLVKSCMRLFSGKKDEGSRVVFFLAVGTVPAALAGLLIGGHIEKTFRFPFIVAFMLIIVAVIFLAIEKIGPKNLNISGLNWHKALGIGLAQAIALIPGTSRSGVTIIAGLAANLKREEAVRFSFLLSIPIIAGAAVSQLAELFGAGFKENWPVVGTAFLFSFIAGILSIKYFLRFSRNHSLKAFAVYRFILAGLILIYFYI